MNSVLRLYSLLSAALIFCCSICFLMSEVEMEGLLESLSIPLSVSSLVSFFTGKGGKGLEGLTRGLLIIFGSGVGGNGFDF